MKFVVNQWKFIRGEAEKLIVILLDENSVPVNIAGASAIHMVLKKADATLLEKAADTGFVQGILYPIYIYGFSLTAAETAALALGKNQDLQIKIQFGENWQYACYTKAVEVVDPVMPTT